MIKNSIYFNHIPKTGGTYFIESLIKAGVENFNINIYNTKSDKNTGNFTVEKINKSNFIYGHFGIGPNIINNKIKTMTLVRNPVDRIISLFAGFYRMNLDDLKIDNLTEEVYPYIHFKTHKDKNDPVKMFDFWLNNPIYLNEIKNDQCFFLTQPHYPGEFDPQTLEKLPSNVFNSIQESTFDNAKKMIDSMIIVGRQEDLSKFIEQAFLLINKELNLNLINPKIPYKINENPLTKHIKKSATKQQIDKIINLNDIDFQIWEYISNLI